jgi:serine/threonine protein kinase
MPKGESVMDKLPTNQIYGNYECTHLLSATSEGAVYKAHYVDDKDQLLAVRTLQIPDRKLDDVLQECNDHMVVVKAITAPHIIPVLDYGHEKNEFYVTMPFIEGVSLQSLIKQTNKTPELMPSFGEIMTLVQALGEALGGIHSAGLAHGTIEPRNILITPDKSIYLADVGIARLKKFTFSLQATSSFLTGEYTAPEIWHGERVTPASDQYSLACMLYLLVTGRAPFQAKTIFEMMKLHESTIVTPPHYIRDDAPFELTLFFLTATAKTPPERYRSIHEFVDEFADAIFGEEGDPIGFFDIISDNNRDQNI